jgi:hypothetical protein
MYGVTNELFPSKDEKIFPKSIPSVDLPNTFGDYFEKKISDIRKVLDEASDEPTFQPFTGNKLLNFSPVSEDCVRKLLASHPLKLSALDALPPSLFRLCLDELLPFFTTIINDSLTSGTVPATFKEAHVHPLLKKEGLDPENLKNFRPVSNLPLLSKLLERVVLMQLHGHIESNGLLDNHQSAYRKNHSCETALLYIMNHLISNADSKEVSILALLDLSAAFDTLDHTILLKRLHTTFGISGAALSWFASYLSDRHQRVVIEGNLSERTLLEFGVPQGSVLGPVLFTLYSQPLSDVIKAHQVNHHKYADDTQLVDSAKPQEITSASNNLERCIGDVKTWMSSNKLKLNGDKTELLVSGTKHFLGKLCSPPSLSIDGSSVTPATCVRDLGVLVDPTLSMHAQISSVCSAANYELKKLSTVRNFLTVPVIVQLVSSLVLSRIDYCNVLYAGLPDTEISRLQNVQNNAARMIFRQSKRQHVTPLLIRLHWLPVKFRITYKIATFAFRKWDDALPQYLSELLVIEKKVGDGVRTRSSEEKRLVPPPWARNKTTDRRLFSLVAPEIWNGLPSTIRNAESLSSFKTRLKTHLFRKAFGDV